MKTEEMTMSKVINMNAVKEAKVKTVEIPEAELSLLRFSVAALAEMHLNLIGLYEKESHLKKHHKAYLHVRDHADQVCAEDKEKVNQLLEQLIVDGSADRTKDAERGFDPDWCAGCENYEACSQEEASSDREMDVFDLPEGMVIMDTGTLGVMQDDMLALTETVDHLVSVFRDMIAGKGVDAKTMLLMLKAASEQSQEVFKRWDEAEMAELA